METIDFSKTLKDLYSATRKVKEIVAGKGTFLAVDGKGAPGGEAFQQAIQCLYSTIYTLKFTLKQQGVLDFKIPKLECLYLSDPCKTEMSQWQWRMLLRIPDAVSSRDVTGAKKAVRQKKELDTTAVKRVAWKEGRALQVMHVGPYDKVAPTYLQIHDFAEKHGLGISGPAHEIYVSDPRAAAPERLKTIVRLAVKKA